MKQLPFGHPVTFKKTGKLQVQRIVAITPIWTDLKKCEVSIKIDNALSKILVLKKNDKPIKNEFH